MVAAAKTNQTKRIFLKRQRKNSLDTTVISPPQWIQWIEFVLFGKWFLYLLLLSLCIVASLWNLSILPWAFCHSPPFSLQLLSFIRCTPTDQQTIQWIVLPSSIVDSVMFMMACIYLKIIRQWDRYYTREQPSDYILCRLFVRSSFNPTDRFRQEHWRTALEM